MIKQIERICSIPLYAFCEFLCEPLQESVYMIWNFHEKTVTLPVKRKEKHMMAIDKVAYWLDIADYDIETA